MLNQPCHSTSLTEPNPSPAKNATSPGLPFYAESCQFADNKSTSAAHLYQLADLTHPQVVQFAQSVGSGLEAANKAATRAAGSPGSSILRSLLTSNTFYSMAGNIVLVSHLSLGLGLQVGCAALAVYNERHRLPSNGQLSTSNATDKSSSTSALRELLSSPGIFRYAMACCFLAHAVEQLAVGGLEPTSLVMASAFTLLSVGSFFVGNELHSGHTYSISLARSPVHHLAALATSGALYWGCADAILGINGAFRAGYTLTSLPPLFFSGALCAMTSIVAVAYLGKKARSSAAPMLLNSFTNLSFAAANMLYVGGEAGIRTAVAVGLWGIGSLCIALGKLKD